MPGRSSVHPSFVPAYLVLGVATALITGGGNADGAIVYRDIPDVTLNANNPSYDLDFDGDGWPLRFAYSGGPLVYVSGVLTQYLCDNPDADLGSAPLLKPCFPIIAVVLPTGSLVLDPRYLGPNADLYFSNEVFQSGSAQLSGNGYLGLLDNGHHGWLRFSLSDGFTIYEYAYESEPGVGILTGAVPEPHSSGLLAISAFGLLMRRRKRPTTMEDRSCAARIARSVRSGRSKVVSMWPFFAAAVLVAGSGSAWGAIVYRDIPDVTVNASNPNHFLDIDGNDIIDLRVRFVVSEGRVYISSTVLERRA